MPTQKDCHTCKKKIGVASKVCRHCSAKQPYKQKLENKKKELSEGWKERQKKNSSVNKVYDATNLLLHKWKLLDRHPILLLARRTTNGFLAECLCPWEINAEDVKDALAKIKKIYERLLNAEPAARTRESPTSDSDEPSDTDTETPPEDHDVLTSNTAAFPASDSMSSSLSCPISSSITPLVSSLITPSVSSSITPPVSSPVTPSVSSSITPPVSSPVTPSVSSSITPPVCSLTSPLSSSVNLSVSSKLFSPASTQRSTRDSASSSQKRIQGRRKADTSECPVHQGCISFPYEQILGERLSEGRVEVLVQWQPCSGCGIRWQNTWEPKENIES